MLVYINFYKLAYVVGLCSITFLPFLNFNVETYYNVQIVCKVLEKLWMHAFSRAGK